MPPPTPRRLSFTIRYTGRSNKLVSETLISKPYFPTPHVPSFAPSTPPPDVVQAARKYDGIWDTGATNSVISQRVVDELGLKPTGMVKVQTASDCKACETFLVSIVLPNKVVIPYVRVTKGMLAGCDVLIGMDIIMEGDFAFISRKYLDGRPITCRLIQPFANGRSRLLVHREPSRTCRRNKLCG
ncbi:retroviral-like aspartic protease family protein [Candidatus Poribacteria bacterium]|nr:retroviral-like aspartic protease family protein [Candidatus Poribacteria bacterium]